MCGVKITSSSGNPRWTLNESPTTLVTLLRPIETLVLTDQNIRTNVNITHIILLTCKIAPFYISKDNVLMTGIEMRKSLLLYFLRPHFASLGLNSFSLSFARTVNLKCWICVFPIYSKYISVLSAYSSQKFSIYEIKVIMLIVH